MTVSIISEETPLLPTNESKQQKETPIPWSQIYIVLLLQLAEPLTGQVIYPFIPQLIRDVGITHGDDTKVGYYVGMMSIFFATEAITVLHWSRTSDRIGRKPVILVGLFGLALSMYCFGLSRSFWGIVVSRSLAGALNGNIGVIKSILAELTDSTNAARAFAYQPVAWSAGNTIGPLIGGSLSHPVDRFPQLFGNSQFLKKYPYFLPCAFPATFSALAFVFSYFFLKETNPSSFSLHNLFKRKQAQVEPSSQKHGSPNVAKRDSSHKPVSLRSLLTPQVLIAAGNYALLCLVEMAYRAIQPVFLSTPIALGGLGLPPPTIGTCLAVFGLANGFFQVLFFADLHRRLGSRTLYLCGITMMFPIFALFPVISALAKAYGVGWLVWTAIGVQLVLTLLLNVCFGCVFIYITAAAPNKRSLGATHGLAQTLVSITRAIGPGASTSLFALSIERRYLGGWLVYYIMMIFVAVAVVGGAMLPKQVCSTKVEEE